MFLKLIYRLQHYSAAPVYIDGKRYNAIVADSFLKRAIGLMFREGMGKNTCMLFVSGRDGRQGITMHNMRFPIDIIWLDSNLSIADMARDLKPDRSLIFKTYNPEHKARYVLEFNSGFIRKNRISKHSVVRIRKKE